MADNLILLLTSPRLPAGLMSAHAWNLVHTHPVYAGSASPLVEAVRAADVAVTVLEGAQESQASDVREAARAGTVVWLADADGAAFSQALTPFLARGELELEAVYGSWDPPGARLLDVVAVMDRLRSPGGCPWDAEQTHTSLLPYLVEEAYEAYDAVLDADTAALREELGDVLLQVAFHARIAEEAEEDARFTIDDIAGELVDKLVSRHPHVFADRILDDAVDVEAAWEELKRTEKQRLSILDGVARSQPALTLAAKYLDRVARSDVVGPQVPLPNALSVPTSEDELGDVLFAVVAAARRNKLDAETGLRRAAERYADHVRKAEQGQAAPHEY